MLGKTDVTDNNHLVVIAEKSKDDDEFVVNFHDGREDSNDFENENERKRNSAMYQNVNAVV